MKSIYLAGPIAGKDWAGATEWRQVFAKRFGHRYRCLNPMRGKDYLEEFVNKQGVFAESGVVYEDLGKVMSTNHSIIKRDQWDVQSSDMVFVNFIGAQKVSMGTVMEIAWGQQLGKYVLVAMEKDNVHQHGMIIEAASLIVPTLEEALDLVPVLMPWEA